MPGSVTLDTFQRCILANQANPSSCDEHRVALSKCAADAVPLLSTIKKTCEPQLRAYDACLAANTHKGDEELSNQCTPVLRKLWECTEFVKRQEMERTGSRPERRPV